MTTQADPYIRVYSRALRDPKFQRLSLAAWGLWTKLLLVADGMYPSSAPLPRWTEDDPLAELVGAGIIDMDGDDFYRVHGLEAERTRRTEASVVGGKARANGAERDAAGRLLPSSGPPAAIQRLSSGHPAVAGPSSSGYPAADPGGSSLSAPLRSTPNLVIGRSTPTGFSERGRDKARLPPGKGH